MNLFINYYSDKRPERQKEIDLCLRKNIASGRFQIHILKEPQTHLPDFAKNVAVYDQPSRPSFSDFFRWIDKTAECTDVNVIANADIYFDDTIEHVSKIKNDDFYSLTRYTVHADGTSDFFGNPSSQDVWIFRGKPKERLFDCSFLMGVPRCDGRLALEARKAGYRVCNPSLSIKVYHLHISDIRNYDYENRTDALPGEVLHPRPKTLESIEFARPMVSVIIPVYNDTFRLKLCLEALVRQTYPADLVEIIVIDNGSKEDLRKTINAFPFVRLFREPVPGSYIARNRGVLVAQGKILAFTDSDCIPVLGWLEHGIDTLIENQDIGLIGGKIEFFFKNPLKLTTAENYEKMFGFPQKMYVEKHQWAVTANLFTYRNVFDKVGLFNPDLKSGGDHEWGTRASKAGFKILYCTDAVVRHPARHTFAEIAKKETRIFGGWYARNNRRIKRSFLWILGIAYGRLLQVRSTSKIKGIHTKANVVSLILYVVCRRLWELVRLICGGQPKRN